MINIFAYRPTIVIGRVNESFANVGLGTWNIARITKIGAAFESWNPNEEFNSITGFEIGKAYLLIATENIDLEGIADNKIPDGLQVTPGINVLANQYFAGIALQTASFAEPVGFDTSTLERIYKIDFPYESYSPAETYNAIDGFEEGACYYGYALADMDLSAYLIPPIVIPSDVETPTDTYKYYGTEATSDKGYYNVPVRFFADEASRPATGIENIVYVAKAEKTSWYWDGAAYQQIGGGGGGSQDLQSVTDVGNLTNNPIASTSLMQVRGDAGFQTVNPTTYQIRSVLGKISDVGYLGLYDGNNSGLGVKVKPISTLTANREILLPDKSGTFALLDDITGGTPYTDEQAQDAAAAMIAAGTHSGITFTYDDAGNKISAAVSGSSYTFGKGISESSGNVSLGQPFVTATDADYTVISTDYSVILPTVTTNRIITLPSAATNSGRRLLFWNANTGGFAWSFATSNKTPSGSTFTAFPSATFMELVSNGTDWIKIEGATFYGANGTLLGDRTVTGGSFFTLFNSSSSSGTLTGSNSGSGPGVVGTNTGSGYGGSFAKTATPNNTIASVLRVQRRPSGTAANGIGGSIDFVNTLSNGGTNISAKVASTWTDVTDATRKGNIEFHTANGAPVKQMSISALGQINFVTVSEYADNAAAVAAGLAVGDVYRTGDNLKIVH